MTTASQPAAAPDAEYSFQSFTQQIEDFVRGVIALDPEQALLRAGFTLLVLVAAAIIIWGLHVILKSLTERIAPKEDGADKKRVRIGRWTMRVARLVIFVSAILIILRLWGFNFSDLRDSPVYAIFSVLGRIAIILILALAAIELGQLAIRRVFERVALRSRNPRRAAQIRTLGPVLSGLTTSIVVIIAAMMALSEVGVEIGPLLAGAGIVGLAVGFGAQTVVKDFLTGLFLIMEDSVSIGDIVMIADFGGVVEEMSLRTIKLRDFDGTVHIFPYSEAQVLHNRSKGFSYAVFDLSIDYSSNIAKALEVMKEVGDSLRKDEEFSSFVLDDIDIVGVDAFADSAIMLKARLKTGPGKQFAVRREYLKRVKAGFDAAGIEIPFPHMKLISPNRDGD